MGKRKEVKMNKTKFCANCGAKIDAMAEICPKCGVRVTETSRSKIVAGVLALLLGGFGIHKFYLGKSGQGILYLLFCWTFIPAIVAFVEGIMYLVMSDGEFERRYGK